MRNLLGLCPLLCSAALLAQTGSTGSVLLLQTPNSQGCPVGLNARRASDGGLISVDRSHKGSALKLRLTFTPGSEPAVVRAKLTVHGFAGPHAMAAGQAPGKGSATESFEVSPSSGPNHLFHSVIYTERLTGVESVELNEITYADGTQWHASSSATCRVVPDGFLLVAGN